MKLLHIPKVDPRYWTAITLASIFGINMGDLYAHESGLGIVRGMAVLLSLALMALLLERKDGRVHQIYYWLVIILIRTGATNIADYLAFRVRIPGLLLTVGLAVLIGWFGWRSARSDGQRSGGLPETGASYWLAMLSAGVFGTVLGDICSHAIGQGWASIGLSLALAAALALRAKGLMGFGGVWWSYWLAVAAARIAGTAIGDWLAENHVLNIGLPLSTLLTGAVFIAVLIVWRSRPSAEAPTRLSPTA